MYSNEQTPEDRWKRRALLGVFLVLIFFPACSLFENASSYAEQTLSALHVQMTALAGTQTQMADTGLVVGETLIPTTAKTPDALPTETELPPTIAAINTPIAQEFDLERALKSAKILLFEDMSASRHLRYVKEALDREGYFYLDVGSAKGWFKSMLLSQVEWDLVIAAAEARRDFGGEFFEYLDSQVEKGSSLIVEYWDWDAAPNGKADSLLKRCGVSFQYDWYEPDMRVFFWLEPDHPVFNEPNLIPANLGNASALWSGDIGDLFKLDGANSEAILLAGTHPQYPQDHAILVSCVNGRVVLQGFSSHEYAKENVIALWQNYVFNALKNRFIYKPPIQPATGGIKTESINQTPIPPDPMGQPASCGEALLANVASPPIRQRDLFEHHADGEFLLVNLVLENISPYPVQIYDSDYSVEGILDGQQMVYHPDKAATGYLFIQNAGNLYQDLIAPGSRWRTNLAFDIDPRTKNLVLVLKPGAKFKHQACEVRISLELDYTGG